MTAKNRIYQTIARIDEALGEAIKPFRAHDYLIREDGRLAKRPKDAPAVPPQKRQWYQSLLCGHVVLDLDDGTAYLCELKHGHKQQPCFNKAANEIRRRTFRAEAAKSWAATAQPTSIVGKVSKLIRNGVPYSEAMDKVLDDSAEAV